jgi:hypothetical protein
MMPPIKSKPPSPEVVAFVNDMKAAFKRHTHLRADEMLAGASQIVGNLIALQDQRKMTPDMALAIVRANIEAGNQQAMAEVMSAGGQPT